jgi:serine/threonine-protein kinase
LATYLLIERLSKPLRVVRDSLEEIGQGRFDCRIAEQRSDEFGELYRAFDAMAARLEEMAEGNKAPEAPQAAAPAEATVITRRV